MKKVATYKTKSFDDDFEIIYEPFSLDNGKSHNPASVNGGMTFKGCRSLTMMIKSGNDFSHSIKIENTNFDRSIFRIEIKKEINVLFSLLENVEGFDYKILFLNVFLLPDLQNVLQKLDKNVVYEAFDFDTFWNNFKSPKDAENVVAFELFEKQIQYVFDRPITNPEWYFSVDALNIEAEPFDENNPIIGFVFMETLLQNPKKHLENYSNDQIGLGLNFIFNNACSNLTHHFKDAKLDFERKKSILSNFFLLFKDVLNERCLSQTSAGEQVKISILNNFCYMFWDVTILSHWSNLPEAIPYYKAIAKVMQKCLSLKNVACIESGLHGLGHMVYAQPKIAQPIIDKFLLKNENLDGNIIKYAQAAKTGMIN